MDHPSPTPSHAARAERWDPCVFLEVPRHVRHYKHRVALIRTKVPFIRALGSWPAARWPSPWVLFRGQPRSRQVFLPLALTAFQGAGGSSLAAPAGPPPLMEVLGPDLHRPILTPLAGVASCWQFVHS